MSEPAATWYRYEDVTYAGAVDECGEYCGEGVTKLVLSKWYVAKETPKGVWLTPWPGLSSLRFVLRGARKRYACPTEAEALESFVARKTRQLRILRAQIARIETALAQVPKTSPVSEGEANV